jgi:hypothetical protein
LKLFENRTPGRTFGPKREEVAGGRRELCRQELHDWCRSPDIIEIIKSRRIRWTGRKGAFEYFETVHFMHF